MTSKASDGINYSRSVQTGGFLELTRSLMVSSQHPGLWLSLLGCEEVNEHKSLCDVAGGTGAVSRWLLERIPKASGIVVDSDEQLLGLGTRQASDHALSARMSFVLGDARSIPLKDASVDIAFMHGALHLIQETAAVIREMTRISRQRVVLFCADMEYQTPYRKAKVLTSFDAGICAIEGLLFGSRDQLDVGCAALMLDETRIPDLLASCGLNEILVRGIMATCDPEELSASDYAAYRGLEARYLTEFARGASDGSAEHERAVARLTELYLQRAEELTSMHRAGTRNHRWDGGPITVWIAMRPRVKQQKTHPAN